MGILQSQKSRMHISTTTKYVRRWSEYRIPEIQIRQKPNKYCFGIQMYKSFEIWNICSSEYQSQSLKFEKSQGLRGCKKIRKQNKVVGSLDCIKNKPLDNQTTIDHLITKHVRHSDSLWYSQYKILQTKTNFYLLAIQMPGNSFFCFVLLVSHLRLSQRMDETDEGWLNHFIVTTLYQNQHWSYFLTNFTALKQP